MPFPRRPDLVNLFIAKIDQICCVFLGHPVQILYQSLFLFVAKVLKIELADKEI